MKIRHNDNQEKIELQMTPMIDIVFQLLIFFIMTFKIAVPEGDFNINMPISAPSEGVPPLDEVPPIRVRLTANASGELIDIRVNDATSYGTNFEGLRNFVIKYVGHETGPSSARESGEVELVCDYGLHYQHVIDAVTHCSGTLDEDNNTVQLMKKIKFSPPKKKAT
jgi:biopolymer transport protein ExbD